MLLQLSTVNKPFYVRFYIKEKAEDALFLEQELETRFLCIELLFVFLIFEMYFDMHQQLLWVFIIR